MSLNNVAISRRWRRERADIIRFKFGKGLEIGGGRRVILLCARERLEGTYRLGLIVSAYGDMANIRTAMNRGAFDFLTKPIDFFDLEATI
jgi:hypothetical protein